MAEAGPQTFLDGRVRIRELPVVEPPFHDGGRLLTDAGELAQIANGRTIRLLAFVEFADGDIERGNHFHPSRSESLYVLRGSLEAAFYLPGQDRALRQRVGEGTLVEVDAGVGHAYRALVPTLTVEFSEEAFTEDGTVPLPAPVAPAEP